MHNKVPINRLRVKLDPIQERNLVRPHFPGDKERWLRIIDRVTSLNETRSKAALERILTNFLIQHFDIEDLLLNNFNHVKAHFDYLDSKLSQTQKLLVGAYFTQEYSIESAGLLNPSIVKHPNQDNLKEGHLRFIMSLRAIGEGHLSTIIFREGVVNPHMNIDLEIPSQEVVEPTSVRELTDFNKFKFTQKLATLKKLTPFEEEIFKDFSDTFSKSQLMERLNAVSSKFENNSDIQESTKHILALATGNFELFFKEETKTSEKAIFPFNDQNSKGLEDVRLVHFTYPDGKSIYYGFYTAYNGKDILPQMVSTVDFNTFRFRPLMGKAIKNKGFALFPRKINGKYVMLSRQDNENNYIMYSDNLFVWKEAQLLTKPNYTWELVQVGNCGSPIELDEGWLVLTHGVGAMRKYTIGAMLLDKENPSKVIGRLEEPLLEPNESECEGYVPNVVYSCGGIVHNNRLILPYAMSDYATRFAFAKIDDILNGMVKKK